MLSDSFFGNWDSKVSPHLKAWLTQFDDQNRFSTTVCGVVGQGTSRTLQANWNSPFEQSNLGSFLARLGDITQTVTNRTSITTFSSTQVWEGNRPSTFSLNLLFYALQNADLEVAAALRELEKMMAPNVEAIDTRDHRSYWERITEARGFRQTVDAIVDLARDMKPMGRIPKIVSLNIGSRMIVDGCVIESMSVDLSKERTKKGLPVRAEVALQVSTKVMLNRDAVDQSWFRSEVPV